MTRERYLEMCEALGNEPVEEEIPVEVEDLPAEVQYCLMLYNLLQDCWDYMGGNYIGKSMGEFWKLVELDEIPLVDRKYYYEIIIHIDSIRAENIRIQQKSKQKPA